MENNLQSMFENWKGKEEEEQTSSPSVFVRDGK